MLNVSQLVRFAFFHSELSTWDEMIFSKAVDADNAVQRAPIASYATVPRKALIALSTVLRKENEQSKSVDYAVKSSRGQTR